MPKKIVIITIVFFISLFIYAGEKTGYDITIFKTAEKTMMVADKEKIGFDVSGYLFLGKENTKGSYLRLGFQTPYDTLINLATFNKQKKSNENLTNENETLPSSIISEASEDQKVERLPLNKDIHNIWSFVFGVGPAYRSFMGDNALVYLGLGLTLSYQRETEINKFTYETHNTELTRLGIDIDTGLRLDLPKDNSTLRIGVHFTSDLFGIYRKRRYDDNNKKIDSESTLYGYAFGEKGIVYSLRGVGYIRLALTFKGKERHSLSYILTSPIKNSGLIIQK